MFEIVNLVDTRIIGTIGRHSIEGAMHEVELRDHSIHALHFVRGAAEEPARSLFLRAITLPDGFTYIVDLRRLAHMLVEDLPEALERDRPGIVKFSLRLCYARGIELHQAVVAMHHARGNVAHQREVQPA